MVKKDKILKNLFYAKFLGVLMKKGKKTSAKKILDNVLVKVSRKTGLPVNLILYKVFFKLNTFVEIRRIRFRRSSYIVPFSIPFSRRIFLVLKWIFLSLKFVCNELKSKYYIIEVIDYLLLYFSILKLMIYHF